MEFGLLELLVMMAIWELVGSNVTLIVTLQSIHFWVIHY